MSNTVHWEGVPNFVLSTGNERGDSMTLKRTESKREEDFNHEDKRVVKKTQGTEERRKLTR